MDSVALKEKVGQIFSWDTAAVLWNGTVSVWEWCCIWIWTPVKWFVLAMLLVWALDKLVGTFDEVQLDEPSGPV